MSCEACRIAKVRCNSTRPTCGRCADKPLVCIYSISSNRRTTQNGVGNLLSGAQTPVHLSNAETAQLIGLRPTIDDFGIDDNIEMPTRYTSITTLERALERQQQADCAVESDGVFYPPTDTVTFRALQHLPIRNPATQHSATLALNTIKSFPEMMLRRQTFPPFVHPLWHLNTLPPVLENCTSIAQLFVARTSTNRDFVWKCIENEERTIRKELVTSSKYDMLYATQAIQMYLIMAVIDQDDKTAIRGGHLLKTLTVCFQSWDPAVLTVSRVCR